MTLQFAYALNIFILIPVAIPTLFHLFSTDQARFAESAGWRTIVGSFWLAILLTSVLGLFFPERMIPVLLIQLIYKSSWLLVYALPRAIRGRWQEIPWGIASSFLLLVAIWPFLIPWKLFF